MDEPDKTVLIIGTFDTKEDELRFVAERIEALGGCAATMDVSVLGDPAAPVDHGKAAVAAAGGARIEDAMGAEDENDAMKIMAKGAAALAARLAASGDVDAMIALGGTMGTDLALDVAAALPLGFPKYVVSTVAFSPLIPAERLSPDIQMILWAGGLYGLNALCRSSLSQAAGAALGAARAAIPPVADRPTVGMTSLGASCLSYMKTLKPALEARGYEVAIFHATGMGGMAYERLAAEGAFACVMDFASPELGNLIAGSVVNSGPDRMRAAGRAGTPQLIAPGCLDLVDFAGWQEVPAAYADRPFHAHNRLIKSSAFSAEERRATARELAARAAEARGPTRVLLPTRGIEEWDKPGGPAHDPEGLEAFLDEMRRAVRSDLLVEVDAHINDPAFAEAALAIFDDWRAAGVVGA
ncbi:MAG: Tm-1-like ATP-binding domain-containing protein [Pseudomonadota bacterium]